MTADTAARVLALVAEANRLHRRALAERRRAQTSHRALARVGEGG